MKYAYLALATLLFGVSLVGCRSSDTSLVLEVSKATGTPEVIAFEVALLTPTGVAGRWVLPKDGQPAVLPGTVLIDLPAAGGSFATVVTGFGSLPAGPDSAVAWGSSAFQSVRSGEQAHASVRLTTQRHDGDRDGIPDELDNCPAVPNGDQARAAGTGPGDACLSGLDGGQGEGGGKEDAIGSDVGPAADAADGLNDAATDGLTDGAEEPVDGVGDSPEAPPPTVVACTVPADCPGRTCVDGYCCDSACTGTCKACNVAGSLGQCTNLAAGVPDPNATPACSGCNGQGACGKPNGQPCAAAAECGSGFCADGFCCNGACGETCKACNVGGFIGTCAALPGGNEDSAADVPCTGTAACDGAGNCKSAKGQPCASAGACASGFCVDGRCCDETCNATCMACNVTGSLGICTLTPSGTQDSCATGSVCDGAGACKKQNGQACTQAIDCASGNCVDGVCCASACTETCKSCGVTGSLGT